MSGTENIFDINKILHHSFSKVASLSKDKNIELIFEMDTTLPRELRGDAEAIEDLLISVLSFAFNNTKKKEIVLTLNAPEDFLYEELISFKIAKSGIPKEKVLAFLETELGNALKKLEGKIVYDENDIHIDIPFTIGELGFRRHYRLPSKSMLQKKVLFISESENTRKCISKMFKYFPYEVDVGVIEHKDNREDLINYDLIIIEEKLVSAAFVSHVGKMQDIKDFKFVILTKDISTISTSNIHTSDYLLMPVTQESIFELIISLFGDEKFKKKNKVLKKSENIVKNTVKDTDVKIPKVLQPKVENVSMNEMIEEKKSAHVVVLDTRKGLENSRKKGLTYSQELMKFLESFDKSDLYFRQIVNEKQSNKIKDFCIDLEKQSKLIGAEGMQKFSDIVSLIFVYDKLDMLPIYPGRYHIELKKLTAEIKKYLHIR